MLILMGLRNGARHLEPQLASLMACGLEGWELRVSDDGSTDAGRAILARFSRSLAEGPNRVVVSDGPQRGFAANYMSMLANLPEFPGPVALADQDDIWLPGRLAHAMQMLNRVPGRLPAFTCARRIDWEASTGRMAPSTTLRRRPSFANALIENVAFGNTIVMNGAAARIARAAAPHAGGIYAHDWFLYQLLTGAGALCLAERSPALLYRQHPHNAIGAPGGPREWLGRKIAVLQGLYALRIGAQLAALERCQHLLLPENRAILLLMARARRVGMARRLQKLWQAGLYRQSWPGNLGFWGAAILGKI